MSNWKYRNLILGGLIMRKASALFLVTLTLNSGCANMGPKETAGTVIGGASGALIGSQFGGGEGRIVTTAIGAVAGSYLGSSVGKQLDEKDKNK